MKRMKTKVLKLQNEYVTEDKRMHDRAISEIQNIASHKIPDIAILDQKKSLLDYNVVRQHFYHEGRLTDRQIYKLLNDADIILKKEQNLVKIDKKCFIFGDVHGQFYDLISVLKEFDLNRDTLIFLGDYVDRGSFGVEVYLYLMLLKSHFPENIYILRGNHESRHMTEYFTFKAECIYKYNESIYERFLESFNSLPFAAIVQKSLYCAHGGISPSINKISDINKMNRFCEIPSSGMLCDIVWSDPHPVYFASKTVEWPRNYNRNCAFFYNFECVKQFLDKNKLKTIIRAHEVQDKGYKLYAKYKDHESIVTIFSAPKYCDTYLNVGAFLEYDFEIKAIKNFCGVNHPYVINGFIDGINWSFPFINEKIIELGLALFQKLSGSNIVLDVEKLLKKLSIMRVEREKINEFEESTSTCNCSMLETVEPELTSFEDAKSLDSENEKLQKKLDHSNISMNVSPSMKDDVLMELSKLDIDRTIDKELLSVELKDNHKNIVLEDIPEDLKKNK